MIRFVLDASAALPWCFRDEESEYTRALQILLPEAEIVVPAIWPFEMANALVMAERRRRISEGDIFRFIADLEELEIEVRGASLAQAFRVALPAAREHAAVRLTVYDAAYLELAASEQLPLATLDADLTKAASARGIAILRPGKA